MNQPTVNEDSNDKIINKIFPKTASNDYHGSKIATIVLLFLVGASLVRSLIHMLAPDGGAGSIAGIDVSVAGGDSIIFAFSLWGSEQLLMVLVEVVVLIRYRNLIPLMYLATIGEVLLRMYVGMTRAVTFSHIPPGAWGNYIVLPLAVVMFFLSIMYKKPSR